ncbi:DUF882 domain-containing protein [Suttonella sp. R2A3]|uniref:YcbK family protein n=1 Tax=Suttonella sp. R2A3 TaxID=2908648 RepID=UPI001F1D033A|nr:DUF882 domain-containing protein [Suttonella sp. R2A3]UJF25202.1 DUF882 domain-containing protein [Suttonella sp. R2A3]
MMQRNASKRPISFTDFEHGDDCPCCTHQHRRTFIKTLAVASAGILLPSEWVKAASSRERLIKMHNPHTGENLRTVFWTPDYGYIQPSMNQINTFFRDFRQNKVVPIDIDLLNILHYVQSNIGQSRTLELHSGYRSPATNNMLASRSNNVGKKSYHMRAQAADISVKGIGSRELKSIAKRLNAGGIGLYRGSSFIHVDSGPVREWYY